jgi:hypothetical protein
LCGEPLLEGALDAIDLRGVRLEAPSLRAFEEIFRVGY